MPAGAQVPQRIDDRRVGAVPVGNRFDLPGPIRPRGDRQALLAQGLTDRLDPVAVGTHLVDEPADQRRRGSSSLAKKTEAAFKISLASFRSRFSALSRLISANSSLDGPERWP